MCGILLTSGMNVPFSHRMLDSLRRRGPDGVGFWCNEQVNLAHTRLAILGLDQRSAEPMENEKHVIAYNGEIYNFIEIQKKIQDQGIDLHAPNDANVLLHAWSLWGEKILKELVGFWAFVVYDKEKKTLTLVRDQLGIKPLYYSVTGNGICVSSLLKTISELLVDERELDFEAMSEYVRYQFTFGDKTFFKSIKKVPPGHIVEIDIESKKVSSRCYEDLILQGGNDDSREPTVEDLVCLKELLRECVLQSTISDTQITTLCSGGLDSSLVTSIVQPEIAYHCNYSSPDFNETYYAQLVTENLPTRLFVVNASEKFNLVDRLSDIINDFDELTIGSVILPLDDLFSQVKRRYKVILTGTGGDEFFGGYVRYMMALGRCNQDRYRQLYNKVMKLKSIPERFELCHRKGNPTIYGFYDPAVEQSFKDEFESCRTNCDEFSAMLRFDQKYFLRGLLNIEDKMAGRHGLETRPSLLNQHFLRKIKSLRLTDSELELKPTLKQLAQGTIPQNIIARKDKMGFTTPVGHFVNDASHLIRERIMDSRFRDFYRLKQFKFTAETAYSREVFGLLMLDLWLDRYA